VVARAAPVLVAVGIGRALSDDSFAFAPPGLLSRAANLLAGAPLASVDGLPAGSVVTGAVGVLMNWLCIRESGWVCYITCGHFNGP
jgi:hypothetical protein